ncbi:MAG: phosphoribosyltransferase family protein [Minisyncoccia bacterium]
MQILTLVIDLLFPPREGEKLLRTLEVDGLLPLILPREIESPECVILCLLSYRTPSVHAAIVEAKFHGNVHAQKLLGDVLQEYLLDFLREEAALSAPVVLVPIPLSRERRRARGYNQVEALCRAAVSREGGITVDSSVLVRTRDTAPQTSLAREARLKNMEGAFSATEVRPDTTYVVVDDVTTTGATLHAAAQALQEAGASHCILLALAH